MLKWEKTKHAATIGILGGCGLGVLITGLLSGQGIRAAEWMVVICFMSLALVEAFSFRARKKPTARRRSTKKYQGAKPPALDEAPEGFYPEGDHTEISEGIVKKGGVNKKPTTPRPAAPKGQGGAVAEAEVRKAEESLAKPKAGFTPPLSKSLFDEEQTKPKTDTGTLGFDKPGEKE